MISWKVCCSNIYFIQWSEALEVLSVSNNSKLKRKVYSLYSEAWFLKIIDSDVCTMKQISRPIIFRNILKAFEKRHGPKMSNNM